MSKSTIFFPLRSNVEWFEPAKEYSLERKIKESMLLYDYLVFEDGIYTCFTTKKGGFDVHVPTSNVSTEDRKRMFHGRGGKTASLTIINQATGKATPILSGEVEKFFNADFVSLLENMGCQDLDFIKLEKIGLTEDGKKILREIFKRDEEDTHLMSLIGGTPFLKRIITQGLNHSLLLSGALKVPILIDNLHEAVLRHRLGQTIEEIHIGREVEVLDSILQLPFPDFSSLDIDDLVNLRKDRAILKFREKIRDINDWIPDTMDPIKFREETQRLFVKDLLEEVKELAPSKKSVAINVFGGLIPYVGSAIGIAKTLHDSYDYSRSWLSLLMKLA